MCFRVINIKTLWVCLAIILFVLLPGAALAESPPVDLQGGKEIEKSPVVNTSPSKAGEQTASVSLEQAIGIAKAAFAVPEGFSQFSTGFDQSDDKSFWNLRWYRSGEPGGEMNMRVNTETGEIWTFF
ncbi:MAG: hypothetical protein WC601_04625 [Desulfotomaculaceae bacterium]